MSKGQKIICIILGIVLLGLVSSMTKPFQNAKSALFGSSSDTLTTYLMNTTSESKTFDSTFCRTQDGVLVALLCNHIISREKQTVVVQEVSKFKLIDLGKRQSPKNSWYITNIMINKKAIDFYANNGSLSVNSNEILVIGKVND